MIKLITGIIAITVGLINESILINNGNLNRISVGLSFFMLIFLGAILIIETWTKKDDGKQN